MFKTPKRTPLLQSLFLYKEWTLMARYDRQLSTELVLMLLNRAQVHYGRALELAKTEQQQLLVSRFTQYVEEHVL
jgi:hypothetical protein